jgi:phage-related protein
MAISGGDGSIILTTKVDETGLKKGLGSMKKLGATAGKTFLAIGAAAATATVAITKMAVDAYADYEQLVGGVETLFKGSAQKVIDYANDAFFTAGVSANEYMQQVTSFSASLIRSTAGDTDKAADIANMALIDISDNVNKMGSSAESVQMAFQGFAKQQYQLLDNLKLGYGGTKGEMERLLKDAQALTGVKYDINNLADVYSAIHAIQEELGITGTTAKEAEKTITGSANMMKAAWQNVLSAIAGGGDLDRAINNLVYSIQKYFENIVPVVERSLMGIGQLIEKVAPMLVQNVASALIKAIPNLINAVFQMIIGLAKGIYEGIKALFSGSSGTVTAQIKTSVGGITDATSGASAGMEELGDATEEAGKKAKKSLAGFDDLQIITSGATNASAEISTPEISGGDNIIAETQQTNEGIVGVFEGPLQKIAELVGKIWDTKPVQNYVNAMISVFNGFKYFFTTLWKDLKNNVSNTWLLMEDDVRGIGNNLTELWNNVWIDFKGATDTWSKPITDSISGLFNSIWETTISPVVSLIAHAWEDLTSGLLNLWNEYGAPLLDNIGQFIDNIISLFQGLYDNVLEPIITPFLNMLREVWDEHISGMINKVGEFIMKLVNGALEIYNKFIYPIVSWLQQTLKPVFEWIGKVIANTVGFIVGYISDIIGTIMDVLNGIIDFVVGVFTGDWEKAWNGIKDVFKGIFNGIISVFENVINFFIDGINLLIDGANSVVGAVGDLFGQTWAIPNIPSLHIPRLAQGAVIPPNREFLAVLGDQKHGTNIEAPLDTIVEAFNIALAQNGGARGGNTEVILEVDGREFGRAVVEQGNRENRRIGTRLVIV